MQRYPGRGGEMSQCGPAVFTPRARLLPRCGNRCWDVAVGVPATGRGGCLERELPMVTTLLSSPCAGGELGWGC